MAQHTPDDAHPTRTGDPDRDGDRNPTAGPLRVTGLLVWRDAGWRSPLDLLALAATAGAFWLVADVTGALAAAALAVVYLFVPPVGVFAAGAVAATALVPAGSPPEIVALTVSPPVVFLLTTPTDRGIRSHLRQTGAVGAAALLVGGVTVLTLVVADATWLAGVALLVAGAAGYVSVDLMTLSNVGADDE